MSLYDAYLLGIIQGITEFLPISSSGHLVLMEHYLGVAIDPSMLLSFDIALHGGSLIAILLYFGKAWIEIISAPFRKQHDGSPPLLLLLIVATIPIGIAGYYSADWLEANTRTPMFVAFGFVFTGLFLIVSSWFESRFAARESVGWKQSLGAGIGQALAVFPGFSRSGLTIASGRLMGLTAHSATAFAFLLGAPALGGALVYAFTSGSTDLATIGKLPLLVGFTASTVSSIAVIHFFLSTIRKYGIWMWSVYLFLAAALIISDEMMPFITALPDVIDTFDARVIVGALFLAMLLESVPLTSFFVPGISTLMVVTLFLKDDPKNLIACIPIATAGLIVGHLLSYIPARQARIQVRWKEKADERLTRAQRFFKKWGIYAVFFGGWYAPIRPWVSIAAGISKMRPLPYLLSMVFGSVVLVVGVVLGAMVLGEAIL